MKQHRIDAPTKYKLRIWPYPKLAFKTQQNTDSSNPEISRTDWENQKRKERKNQIQFEFRYIIEFALVQVKANERKKNTPQNGSSLYIYSPCPVPWVWPAYARFHIDQKYPLIPFTNIYCLVIKPFFFVYSEISEEKFSGY